MFSHRNSRPATTYLLDMVDQGMINKDALIADLLGWMSEADVSEFVRRNDYIVEEEDAE